MHIPSALMRLLALAGLLTAATGACSASALQPVADFGANPGNLDMYVHIPDVVQAPAPVVLVLHGCTQDATYADAIGMTALADAYGFVVVAAETQVGNNFNRCFNWFETGDAARDVGEAASLRQMVTHVGTLVDVDDSRVFVTGLSAGGAMTNVMLAAYPDVFAAGAPVAGVPYRCSTGIADAFSCMNGTQILDDTTAAAQVTGASNHGGPWPRVQVWQGTADTTVVEANGAATAGQWRTVHGLPTSPSSTTQVGGGERQQWTQGNDVVVELRTVDGMGHGTPVDPPACGTATAYVLDVGVCSSASIAQFFGLTDDGPVVDVDAGQPPVDDGGTRPPDDGGVASLPEGSWVETFDDGGPDLDGWRVGGDVVYENNAAQVEASSNSTFSCFEGEQTTTLSRTLQAPAGSSLRVRTRVEMQALVTIFSTASVEVAVDDNVLFADDVVFDVRNDEMFVEQTFVLSDGGDELVMTATAFSNVCITVSSLLEVDEVALTLPVDDAGMIVDAGVAMGDDAGPVDDDDGGTPDAGAATDADAGAVDDAGVDNDDAGALDADAGEGPQPEPQPEPQPDAQPEDDVAEGCSCDASPSSSALWATMLLTLWGLRRRRR